MTDNRTNEPTAEQILVDEWIRQADRAKSMTGMDAIWFPDAEETLAVLRANGLLSEGAPSEEQIERAAEALAAWDGFEWSGDWEGTISRDAYRNGATRALTAAGVAPQGPQALDPEKVAEALCRGIHSTRFQYRATRFACEDCSKGSRALCVAYTEGKLR